MLALRSTRKLIDDFEATENIQDPNIYMVREWLMDELEHRNPAAFDAWIESDGSPKTARQLFLKE